MAQSGNGCIAPSSPIPARKSCSSQSQVNDLTKQTMKMKSVFTITIIALLPIAAFAQTPPAPPQPPQPRTHQECQDITSRECRVITKKGQGSCHLSRCGHVAGANGRERSAWPGERLRVGCRLCRTEQPCCYCWRSTERHPQIAKRPNSIEPSQLRKLLQTFPEGTEVTLTVLRKGQKQKLTAKLVRKEVPQRRGAFPVGNHDWHWDFDATGDVSEQMQNLKEQLKEQLGDQRGIIREAVTQAHEAARRARDDARRAADQLRIFFEDDGAVKASKIDLGKAQIVSQTTKANSNWRTWTEGNSSR